MNVLGRTLVHEFHIPYRRTDCNSFFCSPAMDFVFVVERYKTKHDNNNYYSLLFKLLLFYYYYY